MIAKDGTIKEVEVLSGHPLLVPSVQDAVRRWRYRPTLLNGRAIEVSTTVDVNFSLGGNSSTVASNSPTRPPATKKGTPTRVVVDGEVAQTRLMRRIRPQYPALARQGRVQGTVKLLAIVGKDGSVKDLRVLPGPPLLLQSAL